MTGPGSESEFGYPDLYWTDDLGEATYENTGVNESPINTIELPADPGSELHAQYRSSHIVCQSPAVRGKTRGDKLEMGC